MYTNMLGEFSKTRGVSRWLLIACLIVLAAQSGSSGETRVVCYYTNWSVYRPGTAKFNPQNINPYLCTHLIYAFGGFTKENTLKPFDKYQDIEKGGYAKFTGLKTYNPNLKTMIAIGGWNEGSSRFSSLVASSERRRELVKNAVKFMRQNKFDGLDLDWEYPAFRDGSKPKDKANYAKLVQELREEFEKESEATGRPRLLLTMAVPAGIEYIDKGYDIPKLNRYLDWMNILSYDYHSAFEPAVNHHAPLFSLEAASEYNYDNDLNIDYTIKHYLEAGAEREKLVLGIPTYGRSYTLFNPESFALGAPADGPGEQGAATREKGYLAYYEICESLLPKGRSKRASDDDDSDDDDDDSEEEQEEWTVVQPNANAMGPYAYKGNQWVGYDDIDIAKKKAEYVAEKGLGGIMFWSIDNDDFRGKCHGKPYPLIEAAKGALYKSLGISEKIASPKKAQSGGKRTRPKPSNIDEEEKDSSRNAIKSNRNRQKEAVSESTTSRRRQNLKRTSTTTAPSSATTPDWGLNTPEPPTTPDPGTDFKCEEEGFFPHPRDCKKYFWCLDSGPSNLGIVAHQFTCPSGLHFNKAADSCDFARNVLCNKKKNIATSAPPVSKSTSTTSTTTTTSAPRTTATPTRLSSQLANLFTTRRPLLKITAATSKTTLVSRPSSTTPIPLEEEYEDEEIIEEDGAPFTEEDPKAIKELIDLIKKFGGIEQLEKYLAASGNTQGTRVTTPPTVSRLLYERVLSQTRQQGERAPPQINSRGPQAAGLEKYKDSEEKSSRWEKPQYTTINRRRPSAPKTEEEPENESVENEDVYESPSSTVRTNQPQYVNIRRGKPTTTQVPESSVRNALYDRGSDELDVDVEDVKNGVQGFEHSNIRRFRPETQEVTTSRYKTIQRARPTSTETVLEDDEITSSKTASPVENTSQFVSYTEKPVQTSPKYATIARFPTTVSPQSVETTTINASSNDNTDSNDVNVEIASPSFASENGIIKNKDSSVLNAQISLLSNTVKSNDVSSVTPSSVPYVSYSTEVTISEDPFFSTSKGTPLFVKRTRPTTTTSTTEKQQDTATETSSDKKVSFNRVSSNVRRTSAQNRARVNNRNSLNVGQETVVKSNDNLLDETNDNVIEYKLRSRVRKIRSTTPSSQENTTNSEKEGTNYGNRRFQRPQQFTGQRLNPNLVSQEDNRDLIRKTITQVDRLATSGESLRKPTFRSRRLQTSNVSQRSDEAKSEEVSEIVTQRSQPTRRFRPSLKDFGPDLSSLTALDSSRRNSGDTEKLNQSRNSQANRRYRPSFASTKPPIEDSEDSDSSITPVRTSIQRTLPPRGGRFTTARTTSREIDLEEEASEASIIPRGRKLSISRFTPRPFSRVTEEEDIDEIDEAEIQEQNDLSADIKFESAPIGKVRLSAPAITVSEDEQTSSTTTLPSINVTKVISSNILLGQSNNRSGILILRRLSKSESLDGNTPTNGTEEDSEAINLSETNIDEHEQNEENTLPVDRPRKRIIVRKLKPKTTTESEILSNSATERIEVTSAVIKDTNETNVEVANKDTKQRVRKVLRRKPATSTTPFEVITSTTPNALISIESASDVKLENDNLVDEQKLDTTTQTKRRRKIVRKKLKPIVTDESKQRILETKEETIEVKEEESDELEDDEENKLVEPTESSQSVVETTPVDSVLTTNNLNETLEVTTLAPTAKTRPTYKPVRKPFDFISTTEPSSTTAKVFSRKYSNGVFTTPILPSEREIIRSRVENSPRRPVFNSRPINRRPFTTPSTTTTDEDEEYYSDEDNEENQREGGLVFVPADQLFTRGPVKLSDKTNNDSENDQESDEEESEEEQVNKISTTIRPVNRFAPGRRPPIVANRVGLSTARESNRPVNVPQGVKPVEDGARRFNRPIAFQPNRSNRFGTSTATAQTETTTRSYLRKFNQNKLQTDSFTTENVNIEAVSAKHKQLFSNPKRFTTIKSSLQSNDSDSTTEFVPDATTLEFDSETTTASYESETGTTKIETDLDTDEWLSTTDSTDEPVTAGDIWEKNMKNEADVITEIPNTNQIDTAEKTTDSYSELTTQYPNFGSNDTVQSVLDKLFAVSRVVEVSSKEDKHKLNAKNMTRLVEEGKIKQELKPTLDKIGEVSRFTLIRIVEGDIPIYLTNLSHVYPVENPPNNPIRIDEARNARALIDFTDSGKENLIASESVNAAYNHKNGVVELVQTPVELDYKTDTDEQGNKVYVIESTTLIDSTETPTETQPTEPEVLSTTYIPGITERMFIPGAVDAQTIKNSNVNVVTPKYVESSTLALEALFGANETVLNNNTESTSRPQPFVVYASPVVFNEVKSNETISNSSNSDEKEENRESSGRSIEGFIAVQVINTNEQGSIKTYVKGEELNGVSMASSETTEKQVNSTAKAEENFSKQTTEQTLTSSTVLSTLASQTVESEQSTEKINQLSVEITNSSTSTTIFTEHSSSTVSPNISLSDIVGSTKNIEQTEQTTVIDAIESTTATMSETEKPILVKTLTPTLAVNNGAPKFVKNRPKLSFPRRYQSNSTSTNSSTRVPFNPSAKFNKNRISTVSVDSKNIPYTTPKYNRTNSYSSGKSRFSATRTQNVPVDTRKKLDANKFKPSTTSTTTISPNETKIVNTPVEPTTSKVTIRRFQPRLSPFARRTSTTSTEPTTQRSGATESPFSDNSVTTEKVRRSSVRPTFYPRRASNRFSDRSRGTTTTTTTNEPSTTRASSLRRRPPSLFNRKTTTSSSLGADSATTEFAEASTARPNRLVVRKYYNKHRGGATQNNINSNNNIEATKAPDSTSRKPFRVGVRRRIPIKPTSSSTSNSTTAPSVETTHRDQESLSTVQQSHEKNSSEDLTTRKVKINKRPLSSSNDLIPDEEENQTDDTNNRNEVKKYSSVIKEDNTVVQQEVTKSTTKSKEGLIGNVGYDVTPDVALAAHQLLSAPLPTVPSYAQGDQDYTTTAEEVTFTRAYLLASISPPIISNDYILTTEVPLTTTKFHYPTRGRKISTTNTPQIIYSSTYSPPVVRRRKPQTPAAFEKISPVTNNYRTFVDYEYYDDDDVRLVGNNAQQEKVILRGSGVIQCLDQGNFPHPKSCKKFISCAKMETGGVYGWEYTCPKGLSFDPVGGICNWSAGLGCNDH